MLTEIISCSEPDSIHRALVVLESGGVIAFPTDTVYGLAVPVFSREGIDRLYKIKERDPRRAIAVLIGNIDQAKQVAQYFTPQADMLAKQFWPGALTLVVPKNPDLPDNISLQATIGIRIPDHPFTLHLLSSSGPLAVTSANLSGESNPISAEDVLKQLGGRIELILDGGPVPGGVPSTVVDCTQSRVSILRKGAVSEQVIIRALEAHDLP